MLILKSSYNDPELLLKDSIIGVACMTWLVNQYIHYLNERAQACSWTLNNLLSCGGGARPSRAHTQRQVTQTMLIHRLQITKNTGFI